jgi:hypothetical protein
MGSEYKYGAGQPPEDDDMDLGWGYALLLVLTTFCAGIFYWIWNSFK